MKVSRIIADIQYIEPAGTIEKFKRGIGAAQLRDQYNLPDFSAAGTSGEKVSTEVFASSYLKLLDDLKKPTAHSNKLQEVETVGKGKD